MSNKDDHGPMGNYLRSLEQARAYGWSNNAWATEQAQVEKRAEESRKRSEENRRNSTQRKPSTSSKKTETDGKVICTELVRQGLFDRADYLLGARYVEEHLTERHMRGYHKWGLPVVRKMRRSPRATAFWRRLAQARADHIAFLYGDASRQNRLGAVLCAIGHPVCYLIGGLVEEQDWRALYRDDRHITE